MTATVRVPATSANLGPGFDAFAAALNLHLTVSVAAGARAQGPRVSAEGEGADELPDDGDNLIWRGVEAYCRWARVGVPDVRLSAHNAIPLERGLGSSAAAAVAGVTLGKAVTGGRGDAHDVIDIAAALEGHPDNAAAAVLGGVVVHAEGRARRVAPARTLRPLVCVPQARQSTEQARALLPASVPLADAAANGARAAVVLAALGGSLPLDAAVMRDVLHEPARLEAMSDSARVVAGLREQGVACCLSGAGPSVLAVVNADDKDAGVRVRAVAGPGWRVMDPGWDEQGTVVT